MLLTEKEAKEKACCQAFEPNKETRQQGTSSVSPLYNAMTFQKCSASKCMAWRWGKDNHYKETPKENWKGFCGLAGRVE